MTQPPGNFFTQFCLKLTQAFITVPALYCSMEQTTHNDDLWNVRESDTVEIVTSEGDVFEAKCTDFQKQQADPRTGEVRETFIWSFDAVEHQPIVSIVEGLKSSPDDPDFPLHKEVWDEQQETTMGYINEITIFGEMEA